MKRRIRYRPLAEMDLDDVAAWYDGERQGLGDEFVAAVYGMTARIAENALQFPLVRGRIRCAMMRRFPYLVFFVVENGVATIVAVAHSSRGPGMLRDRLQSEG
jgi:plasmid stabilization system protein ParE